MEQSLNFLATILGGFATAIAAAWMIYRDVRSVGSHQGGGARSSRWRFVILVAVSAVLLCGSLYHTHRRARMAEEFSGALLAAVVNLEKDQLIASADDLKRAISMNPSNVEAKLLLADCTERMGDIARAVEMYIRVGEQHPKHPDAAVARATHLFRLAERERKAGSATNGIPSLELSIEAIDRIPNPHARAIGQRLRSRVALYQLRPDAELAQAAAVDYRTIAELTSAREKLLAGYNMACILCKEAELLMDSGSGMGPSVGAIGLSDRGVQAKLDAAVRYIEGSFAAFGSGEYIPAEAKELFRGAFPVTGRYPDPEIGLLSRSVKHHERLRALAEDVIWSAADDGTETG